MIAFYDIRNIGTFKKTLKIGCFLGMPCLTQYKRLMLSEKHIQQVLLTATAYARYDFNHTVLFFVNHLFQVSVSFDYHSQTNFVQSNVFRLQ